jgi:hypothetical protein
MPLLGKLNLANSHLDMLDQEQTMESTQVLAFSHQQEDELKLCHAWVDTLTQFFSSVPLVYITLNFVHLLITPW